MSLCPLNTSQLDGEAELLEDELQTDGPQMGGGLGHLGCGSRAQLLLQLRPALSLHPRPDEGMID